MSHGGASRRCVCRVGKLGDSEVEDCGLALRVAESVRKVRVLPEAVSIF